MAATQTVERAVAAERRSERGEAAPPAYWGGSRGGWGLFRYQRAPESVRDAFDRRLRAEVRAESDFNRYLSDLYDDDPVSPRQPEGRLPIKPLHWTAAWDRRADKRRRKWQPEEKFEPEPLRALDLRAAWPVLTGDEVPHFGRVSCPMPAHEDRNPSCHVQELRWRCYGCNESGDIIDLASALWGVTEFPELLKRLYDLFGIRSAA